MDIVIEKVAGVQKFLKLTFGIVPIVAGADKFSNLLAHWSDYLNPTLADLLPFSSSTFMMIIGVIEIVAGVLVLIKPKAGALVVSAWLVLIALTLIASGQFLDVAVRDLVMAVGAFTLYALTAVLASVNKSQA